MSAYIQYVIYILHICIYNTLYMYIRIHTRTHIVYILNILRLEACTLSLPIIGYHGGLHIVGIQMFESESLAQVLYVLLGKGLGATL